MAKDTISGSLKIFMHLHHYTTLVPHRNLVWCGILVLSSELIASIKHSLNQCVRVLSLWLDYSWIGDRTLTLLFVLSCHCEHAIPIAEYAYTRPYALLSVSSFVFGVWTSDPDTSVSFGFGSVSGFRHSCSVCCLFLWVRGMNVHSFSMRCGLTVWVCCFELAQVERSSVHMCCVLRGTWFMFTLCAFMLYFILCCVACGLFFFGRMLSCCHILFGHMACDWVHWSCVNFCFVWCEHMAFRGCFYVPCALLSIV